MTKFRDLSIGAIFKLSKSSSVLYVKTLSFKADYGMERNAFNTDTGNFTHFENNRSVVYIGKVRDPNKKDVIVTQG